MKRLLLFCLLVLVIPVTAQGVFHLQYGDTRTATLREGDVDFWTFDGAAGDTVLIRMATDYADPYLLLIDPNGQIVAYNDDYCQLNSQIGPLSLLADGRYTIAARLFNSEGESTYAINLESTLFEHVGELQSGEALAGSLLEDADYWMFDANVGDVIDVSAHSDVFDATLMLLAPDGHFLCACDDYDGTDARICGYLLAEGGDYTVLVKPFERGFYGDYTVEFNLYENTSRNIAIGETSQGMVENVRGDFWLFEGQAGDVINATAHSDTIDTMLYIFTQHGTPIGFNDDLSGTNASLGAVLLPEDGLYWMVVDSKDNIPGEYDLTLESVAEPFELAFGDAHTGEFEANTRQLYTFEGEMGAAMTLTFTSETISPLIYVRLPNGLLYTFHNRNSQTSVDMGTFDLPISGLYSITIEADAAGAYELQLGLVTE